MIKTMIKKIGIITLISILTLTCYGITQVSAAGDGRVDTSESKESKEKKSESKENDNDVDIHHATIKQDSEEKKSKSKESDNYVDIRHATIKQDSEEKKSESKESDNNVDIQIATIKQDSRGRNGENSLAYLDTLYDNISQAMLNNDIDFVSSCCVDKVSRTVKVGIIEMKDEYIQKLKKFESMGSALDIFQQDFAVAE